MDPVALVRAREAVRSALFDAPLTQAPAAEQPRVGRYHLLEQIGQGGFGTVFRAHDPQLRRDVAVKLVPLGPLARESDAEALSEARAMARLRHPSLVLVHDVGVCDASWLLDEPAERCVFIVMELLTGRSLRHWQTASKRSVRDILRVYAQIGRAVAVAHEHDIVHLDIKPANIQIDGARVIVMDFGLATLVADRSPTGAAPAKFIAGTPAYMAPEQHLGDPVDFAADQYALATCLYEALYGRLPLDDVERAVRVQVKLSRAPKIPPRRGLSLRQRRALRRALDPDPRQRFGSVMAFVDAIAPRRWRRWSVTAVGVVLASLWGLSSARGQGCERPDPRAQSVWSDDIEQRAERAFSRIERDDAQRALELVRTTMPQQTSRWVQARLEACRQRADDERGPSARDLCLERYFGRLAAVSRLLQEGDDMVVRHVPRVLEMLDGIERCQQEQALLPTPPWFSDDDNVTAGLEIDAMISRARAEHHIGRFADAEALVSDALAKAHRLGSDALEAEARALQCVMVSPAPKRRTEHASCDEALSAVERVERPDLAIDILLHMAILREKTDPQTTAGYVKLAEAKRDQLPHDPRRNATLERARAVWVDAAEGRYHDALERLERAERQFIALDGPRSRSVTWTKSYRSDVLLQAGRLQESIEVEREALKITEELYGPNHPWAKISLTNIGLRLTGTADYAPAEEALKRAIAITESNEGPFSPELLGPLSGLRKAAHDTGDIEAALGYVRRATEILNRSAPGDPRLSIWEARRIELERVAGDPQPCRELQALMKPFGGNFAPNVKVLLGGLAGTCWRDAQELEAAYSIYRELVDHMERWPATANTEIHYQEKLAWSAYQTGREDEAQRWLERISTDPVTDDDTRRKVFAIRALLAGLETDAGRQLSSEARKTTPEDPFARGYDEALQAARDWLDKD